MIRASGKALSGQTMDMAKIGKRVYAAAVSAIFGLACISPQAFAQTNAGPARFEETNPSVSYTVGWTQGDTSGTWSGGTAAVSSAPGAQATMSFTGTSVSWIGGRTPQTGIARVFLDGVFVAEADTYSKSQEVRVPMFAAIGLADASHTFTIEVTGRQNASAAAAPIVLGALYGPAMVILPLHVTGPFAPATAWLVQ